MTWNWQQDDWPHFRYKDQVLAPLENRFLRQSGELCGAFRYLTPEDKQGLTVTLISEESLKTSEIEGEYLNRDSLQSSIRRQFGLQADERKIPSAEHGLSEMMVNLYKTYAAPLTHETLFAWHDALTKGRRDLMEKGGYRSHSDPMMVCSPSRSTRASTKDKASRRACTS